MLSRDQSLPLHGPCQTRTSFRAGMGHAISYQTIVTRVSHAARAFTRPQASLSHVRQVGTHLRAVLPPATWNLHVPNVVGLGWPSAGPLSISRHMPTSYPLNPAPVASKGPATAQLRAPAASPERPSPAAWASARWPPHPQEEVARCPSRIRRALTCRS